MIDHSLMISSIQLAPAREPGAPGADVVVPQHQGPQVREVVAGSQQVVAVAQAQARQVQLARVPHQLPICIPKVTQQQQQKKLNEEASRSEPGLRPVQVRPAGDLGRRQDLVRVGPAEEPGCLPAQEGWGGVDVFIGPRPRHQRPLLPDLPVVVREMIFFFFFFRHPPSGSSRRDFCSFCRTKKM